MLKGKSNSPITNKTSTKEIQTEKIVEIGNDSVSLEILQKKWNDIILFLEKEHAMLYYALKDITFTFYNNKIILTPHSSSHESSIKNQEKYLNHHAQKVLNNKKIVFDIQSFSSEKKKENQSLFLVKDKYKYLVSRNKNIQKLRDTFMLDI